MALTVVGKKSNAEMLSGLQAIGYPQISAFLWNLDGSATVTTPDPMSDGMKSDVIQYISGSTAWKAE